MPVVALALVVWAALTRRMPDAMRRATLVGAIVLACLPFTLIRTAGLIGSGSELHWRWTPTPEERLLAQAKAGTGARPPRRRLPRLPWTPPAAAVAAEKPVKATPPTAKEAHPCR